jgi:hypothetical protein
MALCFSDRGRAHQFGIYIQEIDGLDNGTAASLVVYVAYVPYIYDIDSLKEPKRTTIVRPGLTLVAHNGDNGHDEEETAFRQRLRMTACKGR